MYGDVEGNYAFVFNTETHLSLNRIYGNSLIIMPKVLAPHYLNVNVLLSNIIAYVFEVAINRLIPSGILQHSEEYATWLHFIRHKEEAEDTRRIFSLGDLEYGFVLYICACAISLIVFFFEKISLTLRRYFRYFLGYVLFFALVCQRMRVYHG